MQALILAGGGGTRLRPLTNDTPKGMVLLNGKPLLEHVLEQLPDAVSDIVIVVGYKQEKIREYFGSNWKACPLSYVEQKEQKGTWDAVYGAKDLLREKFIVMHCDDIGDKASFTEGAKYEYCLFVAERDNPQAYGVVELNDNGTLKTIVEKPAHPMGNLVNAGAMILSPESLKISPVKNARLGEYFLTDLLAEIAKTKPVQVVRLNRWITVTSPEDLTKAEVLLKKA